jgi:hypothetical protein
MTGSLNLRQANKYLKLATELQLHRQMTGRHTLRTSQNLQGTLDNYLVLSSIGFNKASMSTLMVDT